MHQKRLQVKSSVEPLIRGRSIEAKSWQKSSLAGHMEDCPFEDFAQATGQ